MKTTNEKHYVYIVECSDKTLYTGYAKDVNRRIAQHNDGKGAKYTRGRLPVRLVWSQKYDTISDALKKESQIKKLTKIKKWALIVG